MEPFEVRIRSAQGAFPNFSEALELAHAYIQSDAGSSLTKSRMIAEKLLVEVFKEEMRSEPRKPLLGDLLADNQFTRRIDRRIVSRLHTIRDMGNLGPHGEKVEPADAARVLDDLCTILAWYQDRTSPAPPLRGKQPRRWNLRQMFPKGRQVRLLALLMAALLVPIPIVAWWTHLQEDANRAGRIIEARKAIEKQNLIYRQTVTQGDLDGYLRLFAEDGMVLSRGELMKGRDDIREWAQRSWKAGSGPIIQTVEIDVRDDLAYEVGVFTRGKVSGSYLVVWKKQPDTVWRIQAEVSSIKRNEKELDR